MYWMGHFATGDSEAATVWFIDRLELFVSMLDGDIVRRVKEWAQHPDAAWLVETNLRVGRRVNFGGWDNYLVRYSVSIVPERQSHRQRAHPCYGRHANSAPP